VCAVVLRKHARELAGLTVGLVNPED
jgi:hypothetical protein